MKKKIEVTAKKVEDAISEGLKILQLKMDDVDVKIISSGGFFKKAVVELYYGADIPQPVVVEQKPAEVKKDVKQEKIAEAKKLAEVKEQAKQEKIAEAKKLAEVKEQAKQEKLADVKKDVKQEKITEKVAEKVIEKAAEIKKPAAQIDVKQPRQNNFAAPKAVDKVEPNGKHFRTHDSFAPSAEQVTAGKEYLATVLKFMKVDGEIEAEITDGVDFNINTQNPKIIGYRGEVLDSLQYLTSLKINEMGEKYVRVKLDGLDYRNKRKGILENLAVKLADKCVRTGKRVIVDSMDSMDRRIIHAKLADREDVITKSEGKEPNRRVVIYLK